MFTTHVSKYVLDGDTKKKSDTHQIVLGIKHNNKKVTRTHIQLYI